MGCSPWGRKELDTTVRLHFPFSLSCIGEGNGNPLQCSCLENPRDGGAWRAAVYGVAQSRSRLKRLSSSSRDIDYAVENNNIKYASYAFTPVVSGLKKKSVYFPPSWVLVAGWPGCGEWGLLFSALLGLLSAVASLLQSSGSGARGLPQVQLPGSRPVALQLVESSQTTGQTHVSCISKPVLSH